LDWFEDDFCHVTIGPSQPAAPAPPAIASSGVIEANIFAATKVLLIFVCFFLALIFSKRVIFQLWRSLTRVT